MRLTIVLLLFASQSCFAQINLSKLERVLYIDVLNLYGDFRCNGELCYDKDTLTFGVKPKLECSVFYTHQNGYSAFNKGVVIADYNRRHSFMELWIEGQRYYVHTKSKFDFHDFLKQNTANGSLVAAKDILLNGKKPKFYGSKKYTPDDRKMIRLIEPIGKIE